ncbi:MAG TPA: hypothetical protein EYN54_12055, partial [Methylococcaceae bacterium]|nr:hypothetical protein [Methylococcaceae bacterium]
FDSANRYRGEFDQISPINDQISGEMSNSEFAISVSPAGGGATEDTADVYAGLIRNIENISDASALYSQLGDSVVMAGLDGFEIVQKHIDANTFDQDLMFEPIADFYKSVWFDLGAIKQNKSDAKWGIKLKELPASTYDKKFPDGSGISIGDNLNDNTNSQHTKYDSVTVGQLYYKKAVTIPLVKMTSGAVYENDEKFKKIQDELAEAGELIVDERERESWRVHSRLLDGGGWLKDSEKTVFSYIPLIPVYGNYSKFDTKDIYFGKTLKLMDAQRGINFAVSGDTEDVAMSPTDAVWMTRKQGQGEDYSRMNIDRKAVRFYEADDEAPSLPFKMPRSAGNPAMQTAMANFQSLLRVTGNMDDPSMGQNPGLQSGAAIDSLIGQSNNGNVKWFKAMEIAICHAYRVCVDAIPRVYDATRQQRILGEDGTDKIVDLNTTVFDEQTQTNVSVNDLTKGVYDVSCSMGAAFQNQQEKESDRLINMLSIDPQMVEISRDVLYKNQVGQGMKVVADRARKQGIQSGLIGADEWTPEEQEEQQLLAQQQANQPPQEDPNMVLARAEEGKAQADQMNAQTKQQQAQFDAQVKSAEVQLAQDKIALEREQLQLEVAMFERTGQDKFNVEAAKIDQGQQKLDQTNQQMQIDATFKQQAAAQQEINDAINNLKVLREAMGVDAIVGPTNTQAYKDQADIVLDEQKEQ